MDWIGHREPEPRSVDLNRLLRSDLEEIYRGRFAVPAQPGSAASERRLHAEQKQARIAPQGTPPGWRINWKSGWSDTRSVSAAL